MGTRGYCSEWGCGRRTPLPTIYETWQNLEAWQHLQPVRHARCPRPRAVREALSAA